MLKELLRWREYRLARTNFDLLQVLVEVFQRFREELAEDLVLLYPGGLSKRHAKEDVLQAYLFRRLNDLLPGRIVDREAWMPLNRSSDLKVTVQYDSLGSKSCVPIEVKWSDDRRTASAASAQLGEKYMVPPQLDNGLYVIAWCGRGFTKGLKEKALRKSVAKDVAAFQTQRPGYRIAVTWLTAAPTPVSPKGNMGRAARGRRARHR